jgi:hypothetical protein
LSTGLSLLSCKSIESGGRATRIGFENIDDEPDFRGGKVLEKKGEIAEWIDFSPCIGSSPRNWGAF